jgi:polyisoprenoid-binding protein YceI
VGQFFDSNPADRSPSGARSGRWSKDLPRTWRAALDLPDEAAHGGADHPGADSGYRLGPDDGTLSLRTGRHGAAAKAGHDLLIHATRWQATLVVGDDAAGSSLALDVDGGSLRVIDGTGGMKELTDSDKADIRTTIDDEILKRQPIVFRSTRVQPSADGTGLSVEGDLTLLGVTRPLAFDVALGSDGTVTADAVITQSLWDITPYSALFGTLKVNDDVAVAIEARLPQSV